jgi:periplasmic protein TonB
MFDRLVVSTARRRSRRTAKFFLCTSIIYLSAVALAFAFSIFFATPKLADASDHTVLIAPPRPPAPPPPEVGPTRLDTGKTSRPDLNNVLKLDDIVGHQQTPPPRTDSGAGLPNTSTVDGVTGGGTSGVPDGTGVGVGVVGGEGKANEAPPRPPDPVKPPSQATENRTPLRVTSNVLQGKVIERRVPIYPELARRIRLQGDVAVEVIISPGGRVESVRTVSGHPMLTQSALEAARTWRFSPTLLNGVPVRVTGVITFVFKLSE